MYFCIEKKSVKASRDRRWVSRKQQSEVFTAPVKHAIEEEDEVMFNPQYSAKILKPYMNHDMARQSMLSSRSHVKRPFSGFKKPGLGGRPTSSYQRPDVSQSQTF